MILNKDEWEKLLLLPQDYPLCEEFSVMEPDIGKELPEICWAPKCLKSPIVAGGAFQLAIENM